MVSEWMGGRLDGEQCEVFVCCSIIKSEKLVLEKQWNIACVVTRILSYLTFSLYACINKSLFSLLKKGFGPPHATNKQPEAGCWNLFQQAPKSAILNRGTIPMGGAGRGFGPGRPSPLENKADARRRAKEAFAAANNIVHSGDVTVGLVGASGSPYVPPTAHNLVTHRQQNIDYDMQSGVSESFVDMVDENFEEDESSEVLDMSCWRSFFYCYLTSTTFPL